jgi:hypothetical protein
VAVHRPSAVGLVDVACAGLMGLDEHRVDVLAKFAVVVAVEAAVEAVAVEKVAAVAGAP